MRALGIGIVLCAAATTVAGGDIAAGDIVVPAPGKFKALVNPDCSHCRDEAKRRAGELRDDERVLCWIRGYSDGGCIPHRFFLAPYRVVSDTYGVFVYDPDAGFARGFAPSLDFDVYGWRNGVMVMKHKDGTLYSCLTGVAFDGPKKGTRLDAVPTLVSTWGAWLKLYPNAVAYHMFDKYQPVELPTTIAAESRKSRLKPDPRLAEEHMVLGVIDGKNARAYPLNALAKAGMIRDGDDRVILWHAPTQTAVAYRPQATPPAKSKEQPRSVTLLPSADAGLWTDKETGSRWDVAGRAVGGDLRGWTLTWLDGVQVKWFAWAAEYPQTSIHGQTAEPREGRGRAGVETLKGKARTSVHSYKMDKGNVYRLTVKGDGFVPQIQIEGQRSGTFANPTDAPFDSLNPNAGRGPMDVSQLLFTPKQTKEYQITVDYVLGPELGKGPLSYTLTIERALLRPHVSVKDSQLAVSEVGQKLEQGKTYSIMVTGRGFAPEVQIAEGRWSVATAYHGRWYGFGPDAEFVATLTFAPTRTANYRVVIGVGPLAQDRKAPLEYTTQIVELKLALSVNEQLTKQDALYPRRGGPHKLHTVKLEADQDYQIDMVSRAFDTYLFLEDSAANLLVEDDDGGGGLNARIIFRPAKTDSYRIVATTYNRGAPNTNPGAYTLTVMDNPHVLQPRFAAPSSFGKGFPLPK